MVEPIRANALMLPSVLYKSESTCSATLTGRMLTPREAGWRTI